MAAFLESNTCRYSPRHDRRVPDSVALGHQCLVTVRDPIDRAISIYRYYRGGSEAWRHPGDTEPVSCRDFWRLVDAGTPPPLPPYMWDAHLRPQVWWLGDAWRDTIADDRVRVVVNQGHDFRDRILEAVSSLGLSMGPEFDSSRWRPVNVSTYRDEIELDPETLDIIRRLYRDDFTLLGMLET